MTDQGNQSDQSFQSQPYRANFKINSEETEQKCSEYVYSYLQVYR